MIAIFQDLYRNCRQSLPANAISVLSREYVEAKRQFNFHINSLSFLSGSLKDAVLLAQDVEIIKQEL